MTSQAETIGKRSFSLESQLKFADLSGDRNPIHVDPIAARRTMVGEVIVYGVDALLWALDVLAGSRGIVAGEITVTFLKPMYLGEEIECRWNPSVNSLMMYAGNIATVSITVTPGAVIPRSGPLTAYAAPREVPADRSFQQCMQLKEEPFRLVGDSPSIEEHYSDAAKAYGLLALSEVAAISNMVGMECPGLFSLDAEFKIRFCGAGNVDPRFSVIDGDERFGNVLIEVIARAIHAEVLAFYLPRPIVSPTVQELTTRVQRGECSAVDALIIGGSRGLGAITAKLIAAGGGACTITYNVGKQEAEAVVAEIRQFGGHAAARQLTVGHARPFSLGQHEFNQVYYFATDRIAVKRSGASDSSILTKFLGIYVESFREICSQLSRWNRFIAVLYPSSTEVEAPPPELQEYAAAKRKGEELCAALNGQHQLWILCPRLPPVPTDQTLSIMDSPDTDAVDVMLPLIRQMTLELTRSR